VHFLGTAPGQIWAPSFGYLVRREGFETQAHTAALFDVLRGEHEQRDRLKGRILKRLEDPQTGGALFHDIERKQWLQLMPELEDVLTPRGVVDRHFPFVAGGYNGDPLVFCTVDAAAVDSLLLRMNASSTMDNENDHEALETPPGER